MADETASVIELDVHQAGGSTPAVKARLERHAAQVAKAKEEWCSEKQARYEANERRHEENRQRILEEKVAKARSHSEHVKEVHDRHDADLKASVAELRAVLDAKQEWARTLHQDVVNRRADKGHHELLKVLISAEEKKLNEQLSLELLAKSLERGSQLADRNRAALEQYKRVSAGAQVEHAKEVHDYVKAKEDATQEIMKAAYDNHHEAAEQLQRAMMIYRLAKAEFEVEHAKEIAAAHLEEQEKAISELRTELGRKEEEARARYDERIAQLRGSGVEPEGDFEFVAFTSATIGVTVDQLAHRLESLVRSLEDQRRLFDQLFGDL